jgi:two-component system, LytTR family, sensor kinase
MNTKTPIHAPRHTSDPSPGVATVPVAAEPVRRYWIQLSDLNWGLIFLVYIAGALISAGSVYTSELAQRNTIPYYYPLLWELSGYLTVFALVPLVVIGFSRLPIRPDNWTWAIPVHLLISIVFGVVHTCLMYLSRRELYALFGLGYYDYGQMSYRFVMEYHKQFLHYWVVYSVLWAVAHYRRSREQEREAAALRLTASELQTQLAQAQLQALRSQLNPHFLFNTLNMVSSVMYEDADRADHMLASLSRMLRMSLEEDVGAQVPVRRELEFVRCAVELLEARFQDRVAIDIQCAPDTLEELVPNMVVYTLIENAIKHHDRERDPVMRVQARVERRESALEISVLDNGPGIPDLEQALSKGVGLRNTRQRLAALYGPDHRFEIGNRPEGGLNVRISIPLPHGGAGTRAGTAPEPAPRDSLAAPLHP